MFASIPDWKDAKERLGKVRESLFEIRSRIYRNGISIGDSEKSEARFVAAAKEMERIIEFKDARILCERYKRRAEEYRKNYIYDQAVAGLEQVRSKNIKGAASLECLKSAKAGFESIPGWKDSDTLAAECAKALRLRSPKLKTIIGIAVALIAIICLALVHNATAYAETDDCRFKVNSDELTLFEYDREGGQVTIPASVEGKAVTPISSFADNNQIISVSIPEGGQ